METLQHVFLLHQVHPPLIAPAPAQEPPIPLVPGTPLMPESPGEAHEVINIPDTPDLVVISSSEDHQEEEDDPKEDQGNEKMGIEQPGEQKEDEFMLEDEDEPQVQLEVGDAESEASTSSFDSGEELDDESDPDYDPSRDR